MKPIENIKQQKKQPKVKVKPFPGQLPEGELFPEKLALANKILKSVKEIKTSGSSQESNLGSP